MAEGVVAARAGAGRHDCARQPQRAPESGRAAAVEAAGCRLRYLPAYSPDLNPIEQAFAKLKAYRRGVAARAYEPLVAANGVGLSRITPIDVAGFYRDCGYHLPLPEAQPS